MCIRQDRVMDSTPDALISNPKNIISVIIFKKNTTASK
jgi:hypothetical protein